MSDKRMRARGIAVLTVVAALAAPAAAQGIAGPPAVPVDAKNMEHVANAPNLVGNNLAFFERLEGESVKRYVVAASHVNGFDIVDITDPAAPVTVGRYGNPTSLAGVNYHPWLDVNPRRNIVAVSIEEPGVNSTHGVSNGIEFVDISDVTAPTFLGAVSGLGGPHTIRMIGDNHVYTTLPTFIIDYTDPANPKNLGEFQCGHEFFEDPNNPGRTYAGFCGSSRWGILDTTDPAHPKIINEERDLDVAFAHEVYPAPDSSVVAVADFRQGIFHTQCPGGGIHFYDISGKYIAGASPTAPKKLGAWFPPFNGHGLAPDSTNPNWASCTMHAFQWQPERSLVVAGPYSAGSWVMDPNEATKPTGGLYEEWNGQPGRGLGPTTWGNTTGNFLAEGDYVNASQWFPFEAADPEAERYVFTNGFARGLDVLKYTGPMPAKVALLEVDGQANGGAVSGVLERPAILTHEGWVNKPLAGQELTVTVNGTTTTVTTGSDGSFSANLGLPAGAHEVTVAWAGDDTYQAASTTRVVQV